MKVECPARTNVDSEKNAEVKIVQPCFCKYACYGQVVFGFNYLIYDYLARNIYIPVCFIYSNCL